MRSRESDDKVFLKWPEFNPIPNGLDEGVTVRAFWKSILVVMKEPITREFIKGHADFQME